LCLDLFTGANEPWGTVFGHARVSRVHMQDCYFAHMSSRMLMPRNAMMLGEMAIFCPVSSNRGGVGFSVCALALWERRVAVPQAISYPIAQWRPNNL